jgi:hypothetical protein
VPARPSGKGKFSEGKAFGSGEGSLKPKVFLIMFKHSVRTAKKTQHFSITKISWLMLFTEVIVVYCENHTKSVLHSVSKIQRVINC